MTTILVRWHHSHRPVSHRPGEVCYLWRCKNLWEPLPSFADRSMGISRVGLVFVKMVAFSHAWKSRGMTEVVWERMSNWPGGIWWERPEASGPFAIRP